MGHLVHPVVTAQDIWDKSVDVSLTVYWNELGTGQADKQRTKLGRVKPQKQPGTQKIYCRWNFIIQRSSWLE